MRCPTSCSTLFSLLTLTGLILQAAVARAQTQPAASAASGTVFLGDVSSSATTAGMNPDEARRLFHGATGPSAGREVTVPLAAARKRLSELREALVPAPVTESQLRIRALEGFLDYDEADQIIYSPGRTRIRYGQYFLEADRVIYDVRLQEVQAEGNVVIEMGPSKFAADSLRYNFVHEEGVGFNVSGAYPPVYFRPAHKKAPAVAGAPEQQQKEEPPQFQKVSKQESIFRQTQVTTCDFKVPHYSVKAREVTLFVGDRIFLRGATFYAWGVPIFYLPAYSRALTGASPWFLMLGSNSRAGFYVRFGYAYEHQTQEPGFTKEKEYQTRSAGKAEAYVDYLSKIGPGLGFDYRYKFDYGRHRGELSVYNIYDQSREVVGAKPDFAEARNTLGQPILDPQGQSFVDLVDPDHVSENERWRFYWRHRSGITKNMNLMIDIDQFSDPDVFYDILDVFSDDNLERERQVTRRSRVALTDIEEAFVARLMFEIKDRIGLNRITDFSDPSDDDFDYNLNPYTTLKEADVDGISAKRWGRVSERLPQFDLGTRYIPMGRRPLYWMSELNLYNNLDKGLNIVSRSDDAYVQGAQFYNRLLRQWKLSDRYTLLGKIGFGAGTARRDGESLGINDFDDIHVVRNRFDEFLIDGVWSGAHFTGDDDGTFLVGKRRRNFNQIKDNYMWGDAELKLNARFSDTLFGNIDWRYRKTTTDYIGDWYASLGSQTFREDLFNYPIREHWIQGQLVYHLARPIFSMSTQVALNLLPRDELYSKEDTAFWSNGIAWANQAQTLVANANFGIRRQQIFDPSDPQAFEENRLVAGAQAGYTPKHQRWYTQVRLRYDQPLNGDVERIDEARKFTFFTEQDTDTDVKWIYGRELGPKYNTEFQVRWDEQVGGLRDLSWLLQRDLHDALAVFRLRIRNNDTNADTRTDWTNTYDYRLGLKFKLPGHDVAYGAGDTKTLRDRQRQPAVAY